MAIKRPTFEQACQDYIRRYTMEHAPGWSQAEKENRPGFYAPQYRTDREWYEHTLFYGDPEHWGDRRHCISTGQTFPLGLWLESPYRLADAPRYLHT